MLAVDVSGEEKHDDVKTDIHTYIHHTYILTNTHTYTVASCTCDPPAKAAGTLYVHNCIFPRRPDRCAAAHGPLPRPRECGPRLGSRWLPYVKQRQGGTEDSRPADPRGGGQPSASTGLRHGWSVYVSKEGAAAAGRWHSFLCFRPRSEGRGRFLRTATAAAAAAALSWITHSSPAQYPRR